MLKLALAVPRQWLGYNGVGASRALNMCPKNGSSEQPILHLSALKRTPA